MPSDFLGGDFTGWNTIGDARVVDATFGSDSFVGYAALITTGPGAVPIADLFAFLETEGVWVGGSWDDLRNTAGAVGSAIVTTRDVLASTIKFSAQRLSNNKDEVNFDRGAFAVATRSGGPAFGGALAQSGLSAAELSGTAFAFQELDFQGGRGSSVYGHWKVAYWVWEMDPTAPDAGMGLLIQHADTPEVPDTGSSLLLLSAAFGVLWSGRYVCWSTSRLTTDN